MKNFIILATEFLISLLIFLILVTVIGFVNNNPDLSHAKINENVLLIIAGLYSINFGLRAHAKLYNI